MPEKTRINITVDESVKQQLDSREDLNVSGLANKLFKHYLDGSDGDDAAAKLRAEKLRTEANDLENEAETLRNQAKELESQHEERQEEKQELWQEAVNSFNVDSPLRSVDGPVYPDESTQGVDHWSDVLNVTPSEFVEQFPEKYESYAEPDHGKGMYE